MILSIRSHEPEGWRCFRGHLNWAGTRFCSSCGAPNPDPNLGRNDPGPSGL
ncbi:hypothetical protein VPHD479_0214 [Vibrio phage D479]